MEEGLHEGQRQLQLTLHFEHLIKRNQVKLLPGLTAPGSHHLSHSTPEQGVGAVAGCRWLSCHCGKYGNLLDTVFLWRTNRFIKCLGLLLLLLATKCPRVPSPYSSSLSEVLMA